MKKLLLSMTAVAAMSMVASAEVVTLDFTKPAELNSTVVIPTEVSQGTDVTDVVFSKGGVSVSSTAGTANAPMLWLTTQNATQYRIYKGAVMTISADKTISQIVLNCSNTNFTTSNATVDTGSFTASSKVTTWTGSSEKVVFTIGSSANMQINSIEVTVGDGGSENPETPETPDTPTTGATVIYSALGEDDATITEGWTFDNISMAEGLTAVWSWKTYNSKSYLNGSGYKNGALDATAYAVSPVIDLTQATGCSVNFDHAAKFQTTLKDLCGFCVREEGATTWTMLDIPTWPEAGAWTFANSGDISLAAYDGKKIQIGFKYGSSADGADTWEIKNLKLNGTSSAGVNEVVVDENAPVVFYNLQGVRVANPENGVFIRVQGNKVSKVLVK